CINKKGVIGLELEEAGFDVTSLNVDYNLFAVFKIYGVIKKFNPDIVHTSLFYANLFGRIAAKMAGVRVILCEEQNICGWKSRNLFFIIADRVLSLVTDRIIACSESVKKFTMGQENIGSSKFAVVYNAFDRDKFDIELPAAPDIKISMGFKATDRIIGTIGRLCEQKGHVYLIEAMAKVVVENAGARLLIVGEGPLKSRLANMAGNAGISDKVIFMEKRRDVPAFLKMLDVFVLPSLWEGLSVVLLEAMYMAKPIVATGIPSNAEAMIDGQTGVLAKKADAGSLAEGINFLLRNSEASKTLGDGAKKRVLEYFTPEKRACELTNMYDLLADEKKIHIKKCG
ncbi:MAG: hypothetical protein COS29_03290, partial [Candidatus Omnitrophica bacterium CG02_land_8_20_14_3_00__42_8]